MLSDYVESASTRQYSCKQVPVTAAFHVGQPLIARCHIVPRGVVEPMTSAVPMIRRSTVQHPEEYGNVGCDQWLYGGCGVGSFINR